MSVHPVFLGLSVVEMKSVERYFFAIQITMMVVYPFLFVNGHPHPFVELPLGLTWFSMSCPEIVVFISTSAPLS
jgi:hypothetical protein